MSKTIRILKKAAVVLFYTIGIPLAILSLLIMLFEAYIMGA